MNDFITDLFNIDRKKIKKMNPEVKSLFPL